MRISTVLSLVVILLGFSTLNAENLRPKDLVQGTKDKGTNFKETSLFSLSSEKAEIESQLGKAIEDYEILDVNLNQLKSLAENGPGAINLIIPSQTKNHLELELVKVNIFADDFLVTTGASKDEVFVELGAHYRGTIKGNPNSIVAISFFEGEIMGLISSPSGNQVIGKLDGSDLNGEHIIYDDHELIAELGFDCQMPDDGKGGYTVEELSYEGDLNKAVGDCIRLYIEVDNDIFNDKGSVTASTNFATGLLNEVITLYANESIASVVSQIVVWDTNSPYSSTSSSGMLSDFQANVNGFNGDLGQLLSYQASGGIAAGFSGICNNNSDNSLSFSSINSTYSTVPTYSWSVMVVTHEFGHLWGSRHTHACVWNGNNTAIDGCSGSTEGSCSLPGFPSQGGTLMSYCHLQSVGINFNEGFGPQPGNVIRNSVANATCTSPCGPPTCTDGIQNGNETGVDCGGPDCPACPTCSDGIQNGDEEGVDCGGSNCAPCPCNGPSVTLTINLDNYPEETSWDIRSGGSVVASGGTYGSQPDGSQVVENICLPADGCYDFTIYDSYGDGICCSYGIGDYALTDDSNGATLASGGSFGSSEATNFCVSSAPPVPGCTDPNAHNYNPSANQDDGSCETCTDGIQNGDETDVDCGGVLCDACPTCTDGIQNGQETGVDCGGPDCPACPVNCDVPGGLAATPATVEATLTWTAAAGANDYNVRARATGTTTWTVGNNLGSPVNYTGLTACTEYEFQVQSNCTGATSAWSGSFVFTTTGCTGCTYVTIDSENFDNGWGIWNDGGSDCRRSANDAPYASGGSGRPVRLRDNTSTSTTTTDNLDLSSYSELTVDFTCYPRSMENGEDLWLQVSTDGGSSYTTVATWAAGTDFTNTNRFDPSVVITGTFTSTTRIRFRNDASGNSDWMYIDDVTISGCASGALVEPTDEKESLTSVNNTVLSTPINAISTPTVSGFNLFPNPTTDILNISFTLAEVEQVHLFVTDLTGKVITVKELNADAGNQETTLDVSRLNAGVYFVNLLSKEGRTTKKFIVTK